ncbi:hypothetical protein ACH5RR_015802 [Cinchona calisaya]|uniref:Uncharacterized protein n=1 Tax=Cinchona calisaya TaxID=153742 RepID=A0ABD2ZVE7_9GENT
MQSYAGGGTRVSRQGVRLCIRLPEDMNNLHKVEGHKVFCMFDNCVQWLGNPNLFQNHKGFENPFLQLLEQGVLSMQRQIPSSNAKDSSSMFEAKPKDNEKPRH